MNLHSVCLALSMPGGSEWILIAIFGLLLFGKRLPEVSKSLGRSIVEFKKGLSGVEEEIDKANEPQGLLPPPDKIQATNPSVAQTNTPISS